MRGGDDLIADEIGHRPNQADNSDIGLAILELVLACIVAVWIAARIYRVGLLMYGKRPTLREIFRWVRAT